MTDHKVPTLEIFEFQRSVKDKDLTSPPSASKGDRYIVAASGASGAWTSKENQIATYNGSGWDFIIPKEGTLTWVQDEDTYYTYNTSWAKSVFDLTSSVDNFTIVVVNNKIKVVDRIELNIMLAHFYRQVDQSASKYNLIDGFIDEYEDETGIDTVNSTNEVYNSSNDYYSPSPEYAASNLIAYFMLEESSGTRYDETVNDNDLAVTGTVTQVSGKFGYGADFTPNSYLLKGSPTGTPTGNNNWSVSAWVKWDGAGTYGLCVFGATTGAADSSIGIGVSNSYCHVYNAGRADTSGGTQYSTGTWYWFYAEWDGTAQTITYYINNSVAWTYSNTANLNLGSTRLVIGTSVVNLGNYFWDGIIDDIGIFTRKLNSTERGNIYNSGTGATLQSLFGTPQDMTLIANAVTAEAEPNNTRIVLFEEDVDAITLNTDLKAWVSIDGGSNYDQVTLADEGDYQTSKRILTGIVDVSARTGTSIKYKITTHNSKGLKLHGTGLNWN